MLSLDPRGVAVREDDGGRGEMGEDVTVMCLPPLANPGVMETMLNLLCSATDNQRWQKYTHPLLK